MAVSRCQGRGAKIRMLVSPLRTQRPASIQDMKPRTYLARLATTCLTPVCPRAGQGKASRPSRRGMRPLPTVGTGRLQDDVSPPLLCPGRTTGRGVLRPVVGMTYTGRYTVGVAAAGAAAGKPGLPGPIRV